MTLTEKMREVRKRLRKVLPSWINFQNLIFFIVILAFTVIVIWSESLSHYFESIRFEEGSATATLAILPGTPTPIPPEWAASAEQTNGILLGAIIILFVILVGTLVMVLRDIAK